jgi:hypothetical protein
MGKQRIERLLQRTPAVSVVLAKRVAAQFVQVSLLAGSTITSDGCALPRLFLHRSRRHVPRVSPR